MLSHRVIITAFALFIATLINAQTTNQHVVMRGETFASIANKYGITEQQLKNANSAHSTCYVGLKLTIPAAKKTDTPQRAIAATSPAETKQGTTTTRQTSNAVSTQTYAKEDNKAAKKEKRKRFWEKFRDALDATSETMLTMSERFYQMGGNASTYTPNVTVQTPNAKQNNVSVQNKINREMSNTTYNNVQSPRQPATSLYNKGMMYARIHRWEDSFKYFKNAAEEGNTEAMYLLAIQYENGRGTQQDILLAAKWYTLGAEKGNPDCYWHAGMMAENGIGFEGNIDINKAKDWYLKYYKEKGSLLGSTYYNDLLEGKEHIYTPPTPGNTGIVSEPNAPYSPSSSPTNLYGKQENENRYQSVVCDNCYGTGMTPKTYFESVCGLFPDKCFDIACTVCGRRHCSHVHHNICVICNGARQVEKLK